jgi:hypothetical protein
LKDGRIAKERRFLRQETFQKAVIFHIGPANPPKKRGGVPFAAFAQVLIHARGEKPLAGSVEEDRRPLFNERAELIEFRCGHCDRHGG